MDQLRFSELRKANVARCETHYHPVADWSLNDWLGAVTGELGEAAGIIKNQRRLQTEFPNNHAVDTPSLEALSDELADVVIYLDLLAARAGIDLGAAVRRKFNHVSEARLGDGAPQLPLPVPAPRRVLGDK